VLCTYGFIHQAADTYVDQLQLCRPEILYPNLSMTPQTEILKNILLDSGKSQRKIYKDQLRLKLKAL